MEIDFKRFYLAVMICFLIMGFTSSVLLYNDFLFLNIYEISYRLASLSLNFLFAGLFFYLMKQVPYSGGEPLDDKQLLELMKKEVDGNGNKI